MELGPLHIGLLGAGLVIGYVCGWLAGRVTSPKKTVRTSRSRTEVPLPKKPGINSLAEASKSEVFVLRLCRADVKEKALSSIIHHLKDVVAECLDRGEFGHQLRVVLIDIGEWDDAKADNAVLEHFVCIHEACPHLPMWLAEDSLDHYLCCVHMGLQLRDFEDLESGVYTWDRLKDDIAERSGECIEKDMDHKAPEGLVSKLIGEGIARIETSISRLDPLAKAEEPVETASS